MKPIAIILILISSVFCPAFALGHEGLDALMLEEQAIGINRHDAQGRKDGVWYELYDRAVNLITYKNGVKHGPFIAYNDRTGKLTPTGFYLYQNGQCILSIEANPENEFYSLVYDIEAVVDSDSSPTLTDRANARNPLRGKVWLLADSVPPSLLGVPMVLPTETIDATKLLDIIAQKSKHNPNATKYRGKPGNLYYEPQHLEQLFSKDQLACINQLDGEGNRDGVWCDLNSDNWGRPYLTLCTYKHGQLDGPKLLSLYDREAKKYSVVQLDYYENGNIRASLSCNILGQMGILYDIRPNQDYIEEEELMRKLPPVAKGIPALQKKGCSFDPKKNLLCGFDTSIIFMFDENSLWLAEIFTFVDKSIIFEEDGSATVREHPIEELKQNVARELESWGTYSEQEQYLDQQ